MGIIGFFILVAIAIALATWARKSGVRRPDVGFGVCGGLAAHFDVNPTAVRVIWVIGTVALGGFGLILYICMWMIVPPVTTFIGD